jgi:hypothetical protein
LSRTWIDYVSTEEHDHFSQNVLGPYDDGFFESGCALGTARPLELGKSSGPVGALHFGGVQQLPAGGKVVEQSQNEPSALEAVRPDGISR